MAIPPYKAPSRSAYDIVIVGGAVIGSSTAYWLSQALGSGASILVVERDSSYEFSSTALSTSAIRQQYSNPINVKISQFGIEIIAAGRQQQHVADRRQIFLQRRDAAGEHRVVDGRYDGPERARAPGR